MLDEYDLNNCDEADTCRKLITPRLINAEWDDEPHSFTEQKIFTDGRIVVVGDKPKRRPQKRADYLLRYARDFTMAVVEANPKHRRLGDGISQAKEYAQNSTLLRILSPSARRSFLFLR